MPKKKCCGDKPRCTRCPLRMLAEGTMPPGLTVRHRRVVPVSEQAPRLVGVAAGAATVTARSCGTAQALAPRTLSPKQAKRLARREAELEKALRKARKKHGKKSKKARKAARRIEAFRLAQAA